MGLTGRLHVELREKKAEGFHRRRAWAGSGIVFQLPALSKERRGARIELGWRLPLDSKRAGGHWLETRHAIDLALTRSFNLLWEMERAASGGRQSWELATVFKGSVFALGFLEGRGCSARWRFNWHRVFLQCRIQHHSVLPLTTAFVFGWGG
jgi:hypothetical protein